MTKKHEMRQLRISIKFNTAMAQATVKAANEMRKIVANSDDICPDTFRAALSITISTGITQKQIAAALPKQTPANISRWHTKKSTPNVITQRAVTQALPDLIENKANELTNAVAEKKAQLMTLKAA